MFYFGQYNWIYQKFVKRALTNYSIRTDCFEQNWKNANKSEGAEDGQIRIPKGQREAKTERRARGKAGGKKKDDDEKVEEDEVGKQEGTPAGKPLLGMVIFEGGADEQKFEQSGRRRD